MPGQRRDAVTDREKLALSIDLTVNFEFGSICDFVDSLEVEQSFKDRLKSQIRTRGNNIKRITHNHLDHFNVTHRNTTPVNADSIAKRLMKEAN